MSVFGGASKFPSTAFPLPSPSSSAFGTSTSFGDVPFPSQQQQQQQQQQPQQPRFAASAFSIASSSLPATQGAPAFTQASPFVNAFGASSTFLTSRSPRPDAASALGTAGNSHFRPGYSAPSSFPTANDLVTSSGPSVFEAVTAKVETKTPLQSFASHTKSVGTPSGGGGGDITGVGESINSNNNTNNNHNVSTGFGSLNAAFPPASAFAATIAFSPQQTPKPQVPLPQKQQQTGASAFPLSPEEKVSAPTRPPKQPQGTTNTSAFVSHPSQTQRGRQKPQQESNQSTGITSLTPPLPHSQQHHAQTASITGEISGASHSVFHGSANQSLAATAFGTSSPVPAASRKREADHTTPLGDLPWQSKRPPPQQQQKQHHNEQQHLQQRQQQHQLRRGEQQQQQQLQKAVTAFTSKEHLLSTRVFVAFMGKILDENETNREEATDFLDKAFFGVVGSHGVCEFPAMLEQMFGAWLTVKSKASVSASSIRGEHWVALYAIGCHLNYVCDTIKKGESTGSDVQRAIILNNEWRVLTNACTYANLMCDICLQLFTNQTENHVPYSVLPLILRRARNTFEIADDEGISSVQPNVKTILLKLHRYVRVASLQQEPKSVMEEQRAAAFASVLGEMMLHCCAPTDSRVFVESFHQHCPTMTEVRCTLYHHCAHNILQEALTDETIRQAMKLLARALVVVIPSATENRRLLFLKLAACGLALGRVPPADEEELPELQDLVVAVRSANLALFNLAMRNNSELYVRCGIHNVLQAVGKRIALLMVVKFYVVSGLPSRLTIQDMIDYYNLPFGAVEACHVWLLPLLVERRINGVMESGVLVLSSGNPFDEYNKEKLTRLAAEITN